MLDFAIKYGLEIAQLYKDNVLGNEKYKYWNYDSYWTEPIKIDTSDWNKIQRVSLNAEGKVIGYFNANVDRASNSVSSMSILNFYLDSKNLPITFIRDLESFIDYLFLTLKFEKINFCVAIGNNAGERLYDHFIQKFGGKIVGIKRKEVKLVDGSYYDIKLYDILREEYKKEK